MNSLAQKYFQVDANFKEMRILSEEPEVKWEEIIQKPNDISRGWFELSRISPRDRIDFTRDFWLESLPFHPSVRASLVDFFHRLDDIAVILRKEKEEDIAVAELVYSLEDNSCFFRGLPPPTEKDLLELKQELGVILPRDYLAFLHLHNGFGKLSELGVLRIEEISDAKRRVMELILESEKPMRLGENGADAGAFTPFFETFGLSSFQCFCSDWYPGSEMGNVYLSGIDYTISDPKMGSEALAFPTFLEWLVHYLHGMNLSP